PARDAERADRADLKVAALDQAEADAVAWAAEALRRAIAADVEQRVGADREILGARKDRLGPSFGAAPGSPVVGRWRSPETGVHVGREGGNRKKRCRDGPCHRRAPPQGPPVLPEPLQSRHRAWVARGLRPAKHFGPVPAGKLGRVIIPTHPR